MYPNKTSASSVEPFGTPVCCSFYMANATNSPGARVKLNYYNVYFLGCFCSAPALFLCFFYFWHTSTSQMDLEGILPDCATFARSNRQCSVVQQSAILLPLLTFSTDLALLAETKTKAGSSTVRGYHVDN